MTGERTAEPTSELGQTEKSGRATGKSALPSTTDIVRQAREVEKCHKPTCALQPTG
jgi:hypothetical protein